MKLKLMRYFLSASTIFVQNQKSEDLLREIKKSFHFQFGRMNLPALAVSMLVVLFSIKAYLRCRFLGDVRVPKTFYHPSRKVYQHKTKRIKASGTAPAWAKMAYPVSQHVEHSFAVDTRLREQPPLKRVA
jgi:hypothetical protein